jgi:hypothetical protein
VQEACQHQIGASIEVTCILRTRFSVNEVDLKTARSTTRAQTAQGTVSLQFRARRMSTVHCLYRVRASIEVTFISRIRFSMNEIDVKTARRITRALSVQSKKDVYCLYQICDSILRSPLYKLDSPQSQQFSNFLQDLHHRGSRNRVYLIPVAALVVQNVPNILYSQPVEQSRSKA